MKGRVIPPEISIYIDEAVARASTDFHRYIDIQKNDFEGQLTMIAEVVNSHSDKLDSIQKTLGNHDERLGRIEDTLVINGGELKEIRQALVSHSILT